MLTLPCEVGLAPLAGYTNLPFRSLSYDHGACFAYTEMISAKSVFSSFDVVRKMLPSDEEPFTGVQVYGNDPELMKAAAEKLKKFGKFVDVNAGCPVKKVIRKGMGGALLKDLDKLSEIVRSIKSLGVFVTVKTRIGWETENIERIYNTVVEAGADMVVIHARTVKQAFKGKADWRALSKIREKEIPLFVSGDVFSPEDAVRALEISGADGVVIARGAVGNPWIFDQVKALISGKSYEEPSVRDRIETMLNHLEKNVEFFGEEKGVVEFRKLVAGYTKRLPNAREFRARFMKIRDFSSALKLVHEYFGEFLKE